MAAVNAAYYAKLMDEDADGNLLHQRGVQALNIKTCQCRH